jgi:AraC-like DNA-binding protein
MRYLVKEQMPISRVAWLLGYREPGAFTHAFRRWTGKSPSEVARDGV